MASDIEGHPTFAVVWSFFNKFSKQLEIDEVMIADLSKWLLPSSDECLHLVDLMVKLMRKTGMRVDKQRWQKHLAKVAAKHDIGLAAELQTSGFYYLAPLKKLHILKVLCEMQFDDNMKFKTVINTEESDQQRIKPVGRDQDGLLYWHQEDSDMNVRVYVEDEDEDDDTGWKVVCRSKEDIGNLITQLTDEPLAKKSTESDSEEEDLIESKFQKFLKSQCTTDESEDKPSMKSDKADGGSVEAICKDKLSSMVDHVHAKSLEEENSTTPVQAQSVKVEPEGNELSRPESTTALQQDIGEEGQSVKKEFKEEQKDQKLKKARDVECEDATARVDGAEKDGSGGNKKLNNSPANVHGKTENMEVDSAKDTECEDPVGHVVEAAKVGSGEDKKLNNLPADVDGKTENMEVDSKQVLSDEIKAQKENAATDVIQNIKVEVGEMEHTTSQDAQQNIPTNTDGRHVAEGTESQSQKDATNNPECTPQSSATESTMDSKSDVKAELEEENLTKLPGAGDISETNMKSDQKDSSVEATAGKVDTALRQKSTADNSEGAQGESETENASFGKSGERTEDSGVQAQGTVDKRHQQDEIEKVENIPCPDNGQVEPSVKASGEKTGGETKVEHTPSPGDVASNIAKQTETLTNKPNADDGILTQPSTDVINNTGARNEVTYTSNLDESCVQKRIMSAEDRSVSHNAEDEQEMKRTNKSSDLETPSKEASTSPLVSVETTPDSAPPVQSVESKVDNVSDNEAQPPQRGTGVSVIQLNLTSKNSTLLQQTGGEAADKTVIQNPQMINTQSISVIKENKSPNEGESDLLPEKLPVKNETSADEECKVDRPLSLLVSDTPSSSEKNVSTVAPDQSPSKTSENVAAIAEENPQSDSKCTHVVTPETSQNVSGATEKNHQNDGKCTQHEDSVSSSDKRMSVGDDEAAPETSENAGTAEKSCISPNKQKVSDTATSETSENIAGENTEKDPQSDIKCTEHEDSSTSPDKHKVSDTATSETSENIAGENTEKDPQSDIKCTEHEDSSTSPNKHKVSDAATTETSENIACENTGINPQRDSKCTKQEDGSTSPNKQKVSDAATPGTSENTAGEKTEKDHQSDSKCTEPEDGCTSTGLASTEDMTSGQALCEDELANDEPSGEQHSQNSDPPTCAKQVLESSENMINESNDAEKCCMDVISSILHEVTKDKQPDETMSSATATNAPPQTMPSESPLDAVSNTETSGQKESVTLIAASDIHTSTPPALSSELHKDVLASPEKLNSDPHTDTIMTPENNLAKPADTSGADLTEKDKTDSTTASATVAEEKQTVLAGETCNKTSGESDEKNKPSSPALSVTPADTRTAENVETSKPTSNLRTEAQVEHQSVVVAAGETEKPETPKPKIAEEENPQDLPQTNDAKSNTQLDEVKEATQDDIKVKVNGLDAIQGQTETEETQGMPVKENGLDEEKSDEGQPEIEVETKAPQAKRGRKKKRRSFYNRRKSRPTVKKKADDSEAPAPKRKKPKMSVLERLKADADAIIHNKAGKKKTSPPTGEEAYRTRSGRRVRSAKKDEPEVWQTLADDVAEAKKKRASDDEEFLYTEQKSRSGHPTAKEPPAKEYKRIVDDDTPCMKCELYSHPETILLCDGCNKGHHMACLTPPLMIVPDADWFCPKCSQEKLIQSLKEIYEQLGSKLKLQERKTRQSEYKKLLDEYTGISLTNIIENSKPTKPKPQPKKKKWSSPSESEDNDLSIEECSSPSSPEIKTRRCRAKVSYDFSTFDKTIMDAIKDDIAIKPEVQESRPISGKDIRTIIAAEKGEDVELETNEILPGRRKKRKLTNLNSSESEAADSGSNYSVSSSNEEMSEEEFQEPEESESESDDIGRRRLRAKKRPLVLPIKRSRRLRKKRIQEDYETSMSESSTDYEDQAPQKKKKKKRNGYGRDSSGDSDEYVPPRIVRERHFIDDDEEENPTSRKTKRRRVMNSSSDDDATTKDKKGPGKKAGLHKNGDSSNEWSSLSSGAGSSERGSASEAESEGRQKTSSVTAEDSKETGM